tara:strand:- start:1662 stop:2585 length:924 start_codon:yes stop_codon:yes gene_type:complete
MKYWIGPMSKNVVDAVIEYNGDFGFIPSRRQVDYQGGYVNNWTTGEFSTYVDNKVPIERDHGGASQGYKDDDGYESFLHDATYFDIIHIDPWKKYQKFEDGLQETITTMSYIFNYNDMVKFEVGTEEAIRKFSINELNILLRNLSDKPFFSNIEYVVVQSGVGLDLGKQINTGIFDSERLESMIDICKRYGVKSKEHNGDYLTSKDYIDRFNLGLDSINIAPQFGQIETKCYLEEMEDDIEDYFKICYDSKRWDKWVDENFDIFGNKKELIEICGHYVLSSEEFHNIKPNIDYKIKEKIKIKLDSLK